jgi:hypothetical protein
MSAHTTLSRDKTTMDQLTELIAGQARTEAKVDGIIQRLDKQNGSIARLVEKTDKHEVQLVEIHTQRKDMGVAIKLGIFAVSVIVGIVLDHTVDLTKLVDFVK